ncbi:protein PELPK1-like [Pistacia vera]|uniref:protein PELPK1-like n=1 Tax=Pistacia vera TaxID=55513 RepID=UPI001262CEB7|nr:protein PELPK1-like [Pistacia vera]
MATLRVPSFILPILLITLSSLSYNAYIMGARHLLETPLPEIPKPKLPELPPLPKVELPQKPELPELPKPELPKIPELPKPELPKIPELPKVPELPAVPHLPDPPKPTLPKDFPVIPTHSTTDP